MFQRSIQANAFIFAVIPTILTALFVTLVLTMRMADERQSLLKNQVKTLAEAIAFIAEDSLLTNDKFILDNKLKEIHAASSLNIDKVAIYRSNGHLFIASNYNGVSPILNTLKLRFNSFDVTLVDEKLIVTHKIYPFSVTDLEEDPWRANLTNNGLNDPFGYVYLEVDIASELFYAHRSNIFAICLIIIGILCTSYLMRLLIKRIIDPIVSIVDTIKRIGMGHLDTRVEIPVQYELDDLKQGINMMVRELEASHEKLEEEIEYATQDIQHNLSLVEEKNAQLDIARKEALEASNIKSQFLATMSHEIRTPLTAILGFTKELKKAQLHQPYTDYVSTINASADNLVAIVNDILDFSKIEAGKLDLDSAAYNLQQTIEDVVNLMSPIALTKGIQFIYEADLLPISVIGDQHRIKQIVTNLLSNAIKFTQKGHVAIRITLNYTSVTQCDLTCAVEDTGIGIHPDKQSKLFTAFSQAESSTSRRFGGTGLGLTISQGLVKQMGGMIALESAEGKGSTFTLRLPLTITQKPDLSAKLPGLTSALFLEPNKKLHSAYEKICQQLGIQASIYSDISSWEEEARATHHFDLLLISSDADEESLELLPLQASFAQKLNPNSLVIPLVPARGMLTNEQNEQLSNKPSLEHPLSRIKLQKIWHEYQKPLKSDSMDASQTLQNTHTRMLAVDDNETNLKLLAAILRNGDVDLTTCTSGQEAVEVCSHQAFDLILMDVQMPIMDGVEATQLIRKSSINQTTPIIAFTAHAFKEERDLLLKKGMDDYLGKPIDIGKFNALVSKWVHKTASSINEVETVRPTSYESGIDWSLALNMAGNKHKIAVEMLTMLIDTFGKVKKELNQARLKHDTVKLLQLIHKFHGSTCYTGVPRLRTLSFSLESQLKKGVLLNVNEQVDELFHEMDVIAEELEHITEKE